jgi:hypothetical protein
MPQPSWLTRRLCTFEEFFDCDADVLADLSEKQRRDVSAGVEGNGCEATICMPELLM